ncbi:MAG: ABC transporter permease [Micromonosporaceae bacterium]
MAELIARRVARCAVYWRLLLAQVRSQTQYRTSFVIDALANAFSALLDVAAILVFFRVTPALGGSSMPEVLLMTGLGLIGFAGGDMLIGNVDRLRLYVRTGLLDAVLTRPLGVLPQLMVLDFPPRRIARFAQSALVLAVALVTADVVWRPAAALMLVLAPIAGVVFFGAICVATASLSFWWIESAQLSNSLTDGGRTFAIHPVTVYSGWFRWLFAYGFGFAFVAYYPALVLLDKPDPLGAPDFVRWLGPVVAMLAAGLAGVVWRAGVRHYRSTGS